MDKIISHDLSLQIFTLCRCSKEENVCSRRYRRQYDLPEVNGNHGSPSKSKKLGYYTVFIISTGDGNMSMTLDQQALKCLQCTRYVSSGRTKVANQNERPRHVAITSFLQRTKDTSKGRMFVRISSNSDFRWTFHCVISGTSDLDVR